MKEWDCRKPFFFEWVSFMEEFLLWVVWITMLVYLLISVYAFRCSLFHHIHLKSIQISKKLMQVGFLLRTRKFLWIPEHCLTSPFNLEKKRSVVVFFIYLLRQTYNVQKIFMTTTRIWAQHSKDMFKKIKKVNFT